MSLNPYDFSLAPNKSKEISAQGRYIYYYKGSTPLIDAGTGPSVSGNQTVRARAGSTSLLLVPGQSYRLPDTEKQPSAWTIENYPNNEVITGILLIGEGDFTDSNTSNTNYLKLDASFANNVTVMNDVTKRVPVTLDTAQLLKLDPAIPLTIAGSTVQYNYSFAHSNTADAVAVAVFTAAQNPNGAYIEFAEISMTGSAANTGPMVISLIAKATAPATEIDGDVVMVATCGGMLAGTTNSVFNQVNEKLPVRIKIPAGKGLYISQSGVPSRATKTVLVTLL